MRNAMAIHSEARLVPTTKPISKSQCQGNQEKFVRITGPSGLMKVGTREQGVINKILLFLEVDTQDVKRVKELFDESFECCKTARKAIENTQQLVQNRCGGSKIVVNLESNVRFGAYCISSLGLISLSYPDIDSNMDLNYYEKQELLRSVLFESINVARSFTEPHRLEAKAKADKSVDEDERNQKIKRYATAMEKWEFGSSLKLIAICREIIEEMDLEDPNAGNLQKQFWKSTALACIKSSYGVFIDEALEKVNNNESEIVLTRMDLNKLKEEKADTLEKVDKILNKIEPNVDKRTERLWELKAIALRKIEHTQYYEERFRRWLPSAPPTPSNLVQAKTEVGSDTASTTPAS